MAKSTEHGLIEIEPSDFEPGGLMATDGPMAKAIRENCARSENAPPEREGEGWKGRLEGFCPVQGYGSVDGLTWYFRARYDSWSFEVWREPFIMTEYGDEELPHGPSIWRADAEYEGGEFDASWMPLADAWSIIESCLATGREAGWAMPSGCNGGSDG